MVPEEHLLVQSLGRDGVVSTSPVFDADYPAVQFPDIVGSSDYYSSNIPPTPPQRFISSNEYRVKVAEDTSTPPTSVSLNVTVDFDVKAGTTVPFTENLFVRLIYRAGASLAYKDSATSAVTFNTTGPQSQTFTFDSSSGLPNPFYLPMGDYAFGVYKSGSPSTLYPSGRKVKNYTTVPGIPFITTYNWGTIP